MGTPTPPSLVEAFCNNGTPGTDYNLIPIPSQVGVSPELASFQTGFPPATRTPRTSGGIPPRGTDMNGILRMITAHVAWQAAGGAYPFNPDVITFATGYNVGAIIRSAVDPTLFYRSNIADNAVNPDVDDTNWTAFTMTSNPTATQAQNVDAGAQVVAITPRTGFLDLTPNAGATTITDIIGGTLGQIIVVSNMHASNLLTVQAGVTIRMPTNLTLLQNGNISLRRRTLSEWVALS